MVHKSGNNIAIIGATGNVGRKCVEFLLERKLISPDHLQLYASKNSAGKTLTINSHHFTIRDADQINFEDIYLCLLATESSISKIYAPKALSSGAIVIDSSSLYRLNDDVPLIVAPVNKNLVSIETHRLYAIANCVASPISIVLLPLHRALTITRVNIVTYQSTSGAGKGPMDELHDETAECCNNKKYQRKYFTRQIAFNVIPQIDNLLEDGYTYEEFKIMNEIQKILAVDLPITATSVRVPVMVGHSVALSIEFKNDFDLDEIRKLLSASPGIKLSKYDYTTPIEVEGLDDVYVGRIRRDKSIKTGLHLWLCSDNLRRGAATDVVEVAEEVIEQMRTFNKCEF